MSERVLPLLAVALTAIGCSVLVNTDYSGGTEPSASNKGGQGGDMVVGTGGSMPAVGGSLGEGGMNEGGTADAAAEGGIGNEVGGQGGSAGLGGTGASGAGGGGGDAGEPEGGSGAEGGTGGSSGGLGGVSGTNATGGAGVGGMAGGGGAIGGAGMGGSAGTAAGMSGAGGMTCDADLTSDHDHCGTCTTACSASAECIDGKCVSSPCDGICATWTTPTDLSNGPKVQSFMSALDLCVEVKSYTPDTGYLPAFNCWNTQSRTIDVNGMVFQCDRGDQSLPVKTRKGGYCVHATAGTFDYAGFVMPLNSSCCKAP